MLCVSALHPWRVTLCNKIVKFISRVNVYQKMADAEIVKRIQQNNVRGEEIVNFIQRELPVLQKHAAQKWQVQLTKEIKERNLQLKAELDFWLNKVIELEVLCCVEQYKVPTDEERANFVPIEPEDIPYKMENIDTYYPTIKAKKKKSADKMKAAQVSDKSKEAAQVSDKSKEAAQVSDKSKEAAQEPDKSKEAAQMSDERKELDSKEKKEKAVKATKPDKKPTEDNKEINVSRLDLRIGRILNAKKHPDAESLYVEEIDLGEDKPRTVVSGLVKFVPLEEMQNRLVVVLCNLKPAKMRGVMSEAMVMCASTPEKVEILCPPPDSVPGERVVCDEFPGEPDSILPPKKKIFEQVAPDLKTDDNCIATYKSASLKVANKGVIKSATLTNVQIK